METALADPKLTLTTEPWSPAHLTNLCEAESEFSLETLSNRFLVGTSRLPRPYLRSLADPWAGGRGWLGQSAFDDGQFIGLAECIWRPRSHEPAELAVLIADQWQRRGVGLRLVEDLLVRCRAAGLLRFVADSHPDNAGVRGLVKAVHRSQRGGGRWALSSSLSDGLIRSVLSHESLGFE